MSMSSLGEVGKAPESQPDSAVMAVMPRTVRKHVYFCTKFRTWFPISTGFPFDYMPRPPNTSKGLKTAIGNNTTPVPVLPACRIIPQAAIPPHTPINHGQTGPPHSIDLVLPQDNDSLAVRNVWTTDLVDTSANGLLNAYYYYFHPAHPFILPRAYVLDYLQSHTLRHLELALHYVGSFYVPAAPTQHIYQNLTQILAEESIQDNGTKVQVLFLLSIGRHMEDQEEDSARLLRQAIALALELGMNSKDFAMNNSAGSLLLQESWGRTWWELLVVDGMMTGVNPLYTPQLFGATYSVALPCDDIDYANDRIPVVTKTIQEFDDAIFTGDNAAFSSGTYRIDAIRAQHKVMMAARSQPPDPLTLEMADTALSNWTLHLPPHMHKPIDRDGQVDEVLFVAHMIINA